MAPFWPQNFKTKLFSIKSFTSTIGLYAVVTLCKSLKGSMNWLLIIPEKPYFWPILRPTWPKNFKIKSFSINPFALILGHYSAVTSCKKSEKFHVFTFDKKCKTSFWTPENFRSKISLKKKSFRSILSIHVTVALHKKSGKIPKFLKVNFS